MFQKWLQENDITQVSFDGRLFPSAKERSFWEPLMSREDIRKAEQYLGYEWPMIRASQYLKFFTHGDRLAQETPHLERRKALLYLVLGEVAEYQGRFLPDLCDGIFAICEETYWGLSAHVKGPYLGQQLPSAGDSYIDLFAGETAELLCVTRLLLADALQAYFPEILRRLDYELERRIITPYLAHTDFAWMGYAGNRVNNWNPWILSNVLLTFLEQVKEPQRLQAGLEKMFLELDRYYYGMPDDGGCDEGASYWSRAAAKLFTFCDILWTYSGGALDFFSDEKLRRMMRYPVYAHIRGCQYANFADGSSRILDTDDYSYFVAGKRLQLPELCALAATARETRQREKLWMRRLVGVSAEFHSRICRRELDTQPPLQQGLSGVLPLTQVAFLRRGSWFCGAKGGFNAEAHNHNDVGSFLLYDGDQPVLIDPGCGVYRRETFDKTTRYQIWTMQSQWHNLPTVNGCHQLYGRQYRAAAFSGDEQGVCCDFPGAYDENSALEQLQRQLKLEAQGICLQDSFSFRGGENQVEENFICVLEPQLTDRGVALGGKYLLRCDTPFAAEIDEMSLTDDGKLTAAWQADRLYRVRLRFDCGEKLALGFTLTAL